MQIAIEIHDLETRLARLRERFAQLVPDGPALPQDSASDGEGTATDQIFAFMRARPGQVMKVSQIAGGLPHIEARLLRNLVFRLGKQERLKKHARGHYSYEPAADKGTGL